MFLSPSDKLPIKLKLMINLLEGMHTSNVRLHIRDIGTSEIQTEFQTFDSLAAIFRPHLLQY